MLHKYKYININIIFKFKFKNCVIMYMGCVCGWIFAHGFRCSQRSDGVMGCIRDGDAGSNELPDKNGELNSHPP